MTSFDAGFAFRLMKNMPVLSTDKLKVVLERPLPADTTPEETELHEACVDSFYGTLVPNGEFLKELEMGEFDDRYSTEENDPRNKEIPL